MTKDSQIDPQEVRQAKAKGGQTVAASGPDGESRSKKTNKSVKGQSDPVDDKK